MSFEEHKTTVANSGSDPIASQSEQGVGRQTDSGIDPAARVVTADNERANVPLVPPDKLTPPEVSAKREQVHVHASLQDLIAGIPITPEDVELYRRKRLLNRIVHRLLTIGLTVSAAAMITGFILDAVSRGEISQQVPQFRKILRDAFSMQASGFLWLGLLLLIATPIMRVLGSFVAFCYERDWRYAGVTFVVLVILFISVTFGKG